MDYADDDTKKIFRDSLVENAVQLCGLLKHLNITNDTKMEYMRSKLEGQLRGISAQDLREDEGLRLDTKKVVDEMLGKFAF